MKLWYIVLPSLCFIASTQLPAWADIARPPPPGDQGTAIAAVLVLVACVFGGLWVARRIRRKNSPVDHKLAVGKPLTPISDSRPPSESV